LKEVMTADDLQISISHRYRRFADKEVRGRSRLYEHWARAISTDSPMLAFLAALPEPKRQPNLLFAAARQLADAVPGSYADLRSVVLDQPDALTRLILARRTQTNEPARCATLLPVLAALPEPLALLEVGASAGLTLLPDRYGYDYSGHTLSAPDPAAPVLRCHPRGPVPVPAELPHVIWRAGIDLNPSMSRMPKTSTGCAASSGPESRTGWSGSTPPSWSRGATRRASSAATSSTTLPTSPPKRPRTQPWSCSTPPC
jgi:uncharacterized protein DUF2332